MKQFVGNACGTVGLLHALCNNMSTLAISKFFKKCNFNCLVLSQRKWILEEFL